MLVVLLTAGLIAAAALIGLLFEMLNKAKEATHLRGCKLVSHAEATKAAETTRSTSSATSPGTVEWGGVLVGKEARFTHFMAQGITGTGKTAELVLFLRSLLPWIGLGHGERVVIASPDDQLMKTALAFCGPNVPIAEMNPLASDGVGWAIGKDVLTPAEADDLAEALIPREHQDSTPYFRDNAREFLRSAVIVLQQSCGTAWEIRDLLLLTRDPMVLTQLLSLHPSTRGIAATHLAVKDTGFEIISTLVSHLSRFSVVAACYAKAARKVSLREFLDREEVLCLSYDDTIKASLMAIYPLMAKYMQDWKIARNDKTKPITFVLDEYKFFAKCDFTPIAIRGRKCGASLVIAFQDVSGLDAVANEKGIRELLGNMASKCFLRVESEAGAKLASACLGSEEIIRWGKTVVDHGKSTNESQQWTVREIVLPSEFANLPLASWKDGCFEGYFSSPYTGRYRARIRFRETLEAIDAKVPAVKYAQRPACDQLLEPLSHADLARLNLPASGPLLEMVEGKR